MSGVDRAVEEAKRRREKQACAPPIILIAPLRLIFFDRFLPVSSAETRARFKQNSRYFCKYCNCYMDDNKIVRSFHFSFVRHF